MSVGDFALPIFSIIMLFCLLFKTTGNNIHDRTLLFWYKISVLLNIFALLFDILGRLDGFDKPWYPFFNQAGNFLLFLVGDLFAAALLIYITLYVYKENRIRLWVIILCGTIIFIKLILLALTPTFHIMYHIDENNVYHRTYGFYISIASSSIMLLTVAGIAIANFKKIRRIDAITFLSFFVFEVIAIILQAFVYGSSLIYEASSLALLLLFLNVQESQSIMERDQLIDINEHDALTNLFSLNKFKLMSASEYKKLNSCGIIYYDINFLKKTNDNLGHSVGDILIRNCADTVRAITDENVHAYRIGGDELVVVICNTSKDKVDELVERWKAALAQVNKYSAVTCSMAYGTAWASGDFSVDNLLKIADEKMYDMKKQMKALRE